MGSRYSCPSCHQRHKFSRYIDTITGKQFADHVGRCDRENSCGYHYPPKQFFVDNPESRDRSQSWQRSELVPSIIRPIDYLPFDVFEKSVSQHERCNLFQYLEKLFREDAARRICKNYFIGTNKGGNTVFWQADIAGKIRQAKVMQYNPSTGRRNKDTGALFAGKRILGNPDANLQQCFFGEYLLSLPGNENKPVAIVESEKTAVIASIYFPEFVWIATGGKAGCKWTEKAVCSVLGDRKVVLFPDLGAYDNWKEKGKLLASVAGCKVATSDLLEKNAVEADQKAGLDIADYLFRVQHSSGLALTDNKYPIIWDIKF
ncbi:MAG: hypothetical protein IPI68_05105 [Chitinophagaceae bacterium]|nr:hypothetical protein [Chitinophagaceae bacterium]